MKVKLFLINAFLFLSSAALFSQTPSNDKWKLISTDNNVSVYYEQGTCAEANVLFLKIVNNNSQEATIDWSLFNNTTSKKLTLKANETITGECVNRLPMFTLKETIPMGKSEKDLEAVITVQLTK